MANNEHTVTITVYTEGFTDMDAFTQATKRLRASMRKPCAEIPLYRYTDNTPAHKRSDLGPGVLDAWIDKAFDNAPLDVVGNSGCYWVKIRNAEPDEDGEYEHATIGTLHSTYEAAEEFRQFLLKMCRDRIEVLDDGETCWLPDMTPAAVLKRRKPAHIPVPTDLDIPGDPF